MEEIWVELYDGIYAVSNHGNIARKKAGKGTRGVDRYLAKPVDSAGYIVTTFCINGKQIPRRNHVVVAESFLGPRPIGFEINHIDGNKLNNRVDNLEYVSKAENSRHARALGLIGPLGGKLSESDVRRIRDMKSKGVSQGVIAKMFGKTQSHISTIVNRKIWRDIK